MSELTLANLASIAAGGGGISFLLMGVFVGALVLFVLMGFLELYIASKEKQEA